MKDDYEDIIDLPRHVSRVRAQMPRKNRAAQFMPFAALTGYEEAICETARLTDRKIELDEDTLMRLDAKFRLLQKHIRERPEVEILLFHPDGRKDGGSYVSISGALRRVDEAAAEMILTDGRRLKMDDVADIQCELFDLLEDHSE